LILKYLGLLGAISLAYVFSVTAFGYEDVVPFILYLRAAGIAAVFGVYALVVNSIFKSKKPPPSDWLLAGILLTWASALGNAITFELGQIYDFDTGIFVNPVNGFFGLLLFLGAWCHFKAMEFQNTRFKLAIMGGGMIAAVFIVFGSEIFG
jgi:hypothetical protein